MKVKNLELKQFRNISNLNLSFNKNINVFVGDNGQGKTNIIESLVYLSSGRSFRVSSDEYLIQYGNEFLSVIADIEDQNNTQNLKVVLSSAGKYLQVNQQPLKKMTEFIGRCNVVLFNPEDINFYSNSPRKRRREIDFELGKMSKRYLNQLSLSNKLLSERNAYLKNKNVDQDYLEILTEKLVDASILIIEMRA
ncbi:DNA replication and repair protein RecF [Erysipelothrix sp. Poltava]|nr:DNA replication and repair protein RecF [Erysipelothrix sp. Poltava]